MMRMRMATAAAAAVAMLYADPAAAQTGGDRRAGQLVYALSVGAARRTTSGTLLAGGQPDSLGQPPDRSTIFDLNADVGLMLAPRTAVLGTLNLSGSRETATATWGSRAYNGVLRQWLTPRVWIEGGLSLGELGQRPIDRREDVTRRWAAGLAGGAGVEVLGTHAIAVQAFVRVSTAKFEGLRQTNVSFQVGLIGWR